MEAAILEGIRTALDAGCDFAEVADWFPNLLGKLFARKVGAGEPGALRRYLDLLRAGGSDYPYELVKAAGVDLATPAPYRALVARMDAIMDEIDAILARRK